MDMFLLMFQKPSQSLPGSPFLTGMNCNPTPLFLIECREFLNGKFSQGFHLLKCLLRERFLVFMVGNVEIESSDLQPKLRLLFSTENRSLLGVLGGEASPPKGLQ
jgi:hypothetical protein